jgi:hypothetical protein
MCRVGAGRVRQPPSACGDGERDSATVHEILWLRHASATILGLADAFAIDDAMRQWLDMYEKSSSASLQSLFPRRAYHYYSPDWARGLKPL